MKRKFFREAATLACLLLFLPAMSLTAFAQGMTPPRKPRRPPWRKPPPPSLLPRWDRHGG